MRQVAHTGYGEVEAMSATVQSFYMTATNR